MQNLNVDNLMALVERIERVDAQMADAREAKKDIMTEAKNQGYIPKAINHILKERKKERAARDEEREIFELYENAVGLE